MNSIFELINYNQGAFYVLHRVQHIQTELHWHRELELLYVKKGMIEAQIADKDTVIEKGQIFIINSNTIHAINSIGEENCDAIILQINEEVFQKIGQSSDRYYFDSLNGDENDEEGTEGNLKSVYEYFQNIIELSETEKDNTENINIYCMLLVTTLIQKFTLSKNQKSVYYSDKHQHQIRTILEYIEKYYKETEIDQSVAAKTLGFNTTYLSRLFSTYTNTTFLKYLNNVRISASCRELEQTEDSITDIYMRNGFSNGKTFNRVFKDIKGMSPREYRESLSANNGTKTRYKSRNLTTSVGSYISFQNNEDLEKIKNKDFVTSRFKEGIDERSSDYKSITVNTDLSNVKYEIQKPFLNLICTGRAIDVLSAQWREHFEMCLDSIPFKFLRFHGLLNDEMGIIHQKGEYIDYNFFYVDAVFRYLLSHNVKPYIELSFMPTALASNNSTVFAYKANISKPESQEKWCDLIQALVTHLITYFGEEEVCSWFFDVWNEPDINEFWANEFYDYLELYKNTYRTIKKINKTIRVGGPAGSSIAFQTKNTIDSFLDYCYLNNTVPDFLSLHPYPAQFYTIKDSYEELQKVCAPDYTVTNMNWARHLLREHKMNETKLHMNEWNSSPRYDDYTHDTAYMATYVIETTIKSSNLCDVLGWWTISDLFDEGGIVYKEFGGGFGLINRSGIKKPAYFGMWAVSRLGKSVIEIGNDYIITLDKDKNRIVVLMWNYVFFKQSFADGDRSGLTYYDRYSIFEEGTVKNLHITVNGFHKSTLSGVKHKFTRKHGCAFDNWLSNGAIEYLSDEQLEDLKDNNHLKSSHWFNAESNQIILEDELKPFEFSLYEITEINN